MKGNLPPSSLGLRRHIAGTALILVLLAGGCAPAVRFPPTPPGVEALRPGISDRLFFGRSVPGGGMVSEADWAGFLSQVVTPRFPDGLTVWRAEGQWRDGSGAVVREDSFVLELIHSADTRAEAAIREIIAEYKVRFRQESVLRVQARVQVGY